MKHIITSVALMAMAAPLSAMTPTELIQNRHHRIEIQPARHHHHIVEKRHDLHTQTPVKRVRHRRTKAAPSVHTVASKRSFHSLGEYRQRREGSLRTVRNAHHHVPSRHNPHQARAGKKLGHYVGNGWFVDDHGQYDEQYPQADPYLWVPSRPVHRQHPYRHYRRQWYLTYLYEHAEFDDRHGYHYGYYDRRGFEFDTKFYEYDRSYTYQDRLHGKGLFEHRFYRPIQTHARRAGTRSWRSDIGGAQVEFHWRY